MRWAILYRDGSCFTHEDGDVWDAPRMDVQAVYQEDESVGAMTVRSAWGFWKWEDAWIGVDREGMFMHLALWPRPLVLFGTFLSQPEWEATKRVIADKLGIYKSAWHKIEREALDVLS